MKKGLVFLFFLAGIFISFSKPLKLMQTGFGFILLVIALKHIYLKLSNLNKAFLENKKVIATLTIAIDLPFLIIILLKTLNYVHIYRKDQIILSELSGLKSQLNDFKIKIESLKIIKDPISAENHIKLSNSDEKQIDALTVRFGLISYGH